MVIPLYGIWYPLYVAILGGLSVQKVGEAGETRVPEMGLLNGKVDDTWSILCRPQT